jgi:predicted TIM-barrel fold metal-dependent hydrolase
MNPTRGLALPREVLEKIYYRNALRVYPRLREAFLKLGYTVP